MPLKGHELHHERHPILDTSTHEICQIFKTLHLIPPRLLYLTAVPPASLPATVEVLSELPGEAVKLDPGRSKLDRLTPSPVLKPPLETGDKRGIRAPSDAAPPRRIPPEGAGMALRSEGCRIRLVGGANPPWLPELSPFWIGRLMPAGRGRGVGTGVGDVSSSSPAEGVPPAVLGCCEDIGGGRGAMLAMRGAAILGSGT